MIAAPSERQNSGAFDLPLVVRDEQKDSLDGASCADWLVGAAV
jgi:hypothetical protein